jgi:hypothetical protein
MYFLQEYRLLRHDEAPFAVIVVNDIENVILVLKDTFVDIDVYL